MVFTTTTLFKGIPCPEGERCSLTNCIFAHNVPPQDVAAPLTQPTTVPQPSKPILKDGVEPAAKRRRVTYDRLEDKPPNKADVIRKLIEKEPASKETSQDPKPHAATSKPSSLMRPVSPPLKTNAKAISSANISKSSNQSGNKAENAKTSLASIPVPQLNPRLIPNDPAGHAKRSLILKYLHAEMVRLNKGLDGRKDVQAQPFLVLDGKELVQLALDEEEKVAREQGAVYGNVIKNRIAAYKKMKLDDWIAHVKTTPMFVSKSAATKPSTTGKDPPRPVDTGLTLTQEAAILPKLVIKDQKALARHGYIPSPPTTAEAEEAAAAVRASANYEVCDRCAARFQVYPTRNEDGLLTSNGSCRHHPNRKVFPQRTKADLGPKEPYYPCCNEPVGSPGCTTTEHHVFKASSPARLAAVMPFVTTPENDNPARDPQGKKVSAVSFDCEMGYTTLGLELIRLTAVSWPEGEALVDILVRPLGIVLDLNSRFSGVWPEHFANAVPYDTTLPPSRTSDNNLPIAASPYAARSALLAYLTPSTPLIGHAIENDLNVVRLCHPTVIDTVVLFPHPRGLPLRYGLKNLASRHLNWSIQTGGERGHDSLEDARATGELVRWKIREQWKVMKGRGSEFGEEGKLINAQNARKGGGLGMDGADDATDSDDDGSTETGDVDEPVPGINGSEKILAEAY